MQLATEKPQRFIQLLKAAIELREAQEYEQALELLEKSLQLAPNYSLTHVFLGLTYQEMVKPKEAERAFRDALAIEPKSTEALQGLGMLLLSQDRFPEGIAYLQKHLDLNPNNSDTLDVLIPALLKSNRLEEADRLLTKAWSETKDENIAVRYARHLLSTDQVGKAGDFLRQAVKITESPHLLLELALSLVVEEKYPEAILILQRALAIRPDYDRALRGLSHCYAQLKQADRSIEYAEQALAINPRHYRNWQVKADALLLLDRNEEAAEAAQTGISQIEPGDEEASPVLGVLYIQKFNALLRLGKIEEALLEMEQARGDLPEELRFYKYPIQVLAQIGSLSKALGLTRQAVQAGVLSGDDKLLNVLHLIASESVEWYVKGRVVEARDAFLELVDLAPQEPRFQMALGYILAGEGDLERADKHLETALAMSEADIRGIILCDRGYIRLLQNRYVEAEAELFQALHEANETALLRIAYWWEGKFVPDYAPHPSRWVLIHSASKANLASLALARSDFGQAQIWATDLQQTAPEDLLTYEVVGTVSHTLGRHAEATEAWSKALSLSENDAERKMITNWLSDLSS